jgi:hypothetical protein
MLCLVVSCAHLDSSAPLRIDGSTPAKLQASWDRLYRSLPASGQTRLELAILPIALSQYNSFKDLPPSLAAGFGPQTIRVQIRGLTYREIISLADASPFKITVDRPR